MSESPELPDRRFGEEGGQLSYGTYLRITELLAQQVPESDPPAHDELLFITVHQAYELWFKVLLYELETARDHLLNGDDLWTPRHLLQRVITIEHVLIEQIDIIETMTPQDFLVFRSYLAPASGFQSVQYRKLDFLSGRKDPAYPNRLHDASADEKPRFQQRLDEPPIGDGYGAA